MALPLRLAIAALLTVPLSSPAVTARSDEGATLQVTGHSTQTPWAAARGDLLAVAFGAQGQDGKADVFVAVSRDGGRQFGEPVRVNDVAGEGRLGGELPPRVAIVERGSDAPELVVVYGAKSGGSTAIKVARSRDGGRSFSSPRPLQTAGAAGDRGWHALAVDGTGTAHVMWLDHRGLAAGSDGSDQHHGAPAGTPSEQAAIDGVAMAQRSGLYYAREGARASAERELTKGVCYCCKVTLASTPRGGLVAAWRHVFPGNVRDIAFASSANGGEQFSEPSRVSADDWHLAGCPDDGPAIDVDKGGTAHVVWPTVLSGDTPEGAIFYAASVDGRSFTARVRVPTLGSPRPMHPQVHADSDSHLFVAWDEVVDGTRQAAVRGVRFDEAGGPIFGTAHRLGAAGTPSSYPMVVSTARGAVAVFVEGKPGASVVRVVPL